MTVSSRSRRGMVYVYSASDSSGYLTQRYVLQGTYHVRIAVASTQERTAGAQAEHQQSLVLGFADSVTVSENDIVVIDNVQYRVEAVVLRRGQRELVVRVFRVDDDVYLRLLLFDGTATFNGDYTASGYVNALAAA